MAERTRTSRPTDDNPNAAAQTPAGNDPLSSPYGPHHHGVDEAAGGADSSPYENVPSGEKHEAAESNNRDEQSP